MQNHTIPAKSPGKMPRLWVLLFIGIISFSSPDPSWSKDISGGELNENTTWKLAESPYEVSGTVQVGDGATLTIEAGVVVKFTDEEAGIEVLSGGSLATEGSAAAPVIFTEIRDDTAGGDTNGGSTPPEAGSWNGIAVKSGGNALLRYAQVRYANGAILKEGTGPLTMEDCSLMLSSGSGLDLSFTSAVHTISRCKFLKNDVGIFMFGASGIVAVSDSKVSDNYSGIVIWDTLGGIVSLSRNTITGNDVGIECDDGVNPLIGGSPDKRNNIYKNRDFGVNNLSTGDTVPRIDATQNWWGDYWGPTHATNPEGRGDAVSDNVDFSDFARISALSGDLNNDNGIGIDDVIVGLQVITGITPAVFHPEYVMAGIDVNGDGRTGLAEAIYNLQEVAGFNE
jgi:hypothetical protein